MTLSSLLEQLASIVEARPQPVTNLAFTKAVRGFGFKSRKQLASEFHAYKRGGGEKDRFGWDIRNDTAQDPWLTPVQCPRDSESVCARFDPVKLAARLGTRPTAEDIRDRLSEFAAKYGWHVSMIEVEEARTRSGLEGWVAFDPVLGQRAMVGSELWHIAKPERAETILRKGLLPKSEGKHGFLYPERVYLFRTRKGAVQYGEAWTSSWDDASSPRQNWRIGGMWAVAPYFDLFRIDTSKLAKGTKFYVDQKVTDHPAYYTHSRIPPEAITHVGQVRFKSEGA